MCKTIIQLYFPTTDGVLVTGFHCSGYNFTLLRKNKNTLFRVLKHRSLKVFRIASSRTTSYLIVFSILFFSNCLLYYTPFASLFSYMTASVKRIAGQSFKFGWTHTNLAGHNTFIRTDSIKKAGLFTLFGSFSWTLLLTYLEKGGTVPPKYGQLACMHSIVYFTHPYGLFLHYPFYTASSSGNSCRIYFYTSRARYTSWPLYSLRPHWLVSRVFL